MTPVDATITVVTKYGKLTVPLAEVVRIEVGFRYPDGLEAKVEEWVTNLGSAVFRDREAAEKALFNAAEYAVPALRRATKNPDAEVARRADSVLKKLTDKLPPEKMEMKDFDLVETAEVIVRGRLESTGVKMKTRHFGETTLQLAEVRSIRSTAATGNEFVLDAAKYARNNSMEWLDTGVDVTPSAPLEILAEGTVDLAPQQGGNFVSGPAGNPSNGNSMMMTPTGGRMSAVPGALYARIGPNGQPFVAGASYKMARPTGTGRLFLKIGPTSWGGIDPSGSYKVKIKVGG
jgi:hypothetical protein